MPSEKFNPIQTVAPDGLSIPIVGDYSIEKYECLGHYAEMFTGSMAGKWKHLVYIDLYSSSGYCQLKNSGKIIKSGALISLSITKKFTRYIFCERDEKLLNSLRVRVARDYPEVDAFFILGDCNDRIGEIINCIPRPSKENSVLSFAFIDPFNLNIQFKTVQRLAAFKLDILMLIATGMAATRNETNYVNPSNNTIAEFLNDPDWRKDYIGVVDIGDLSFTQFLASKYKANMERIGYTKSSDFYVVRLKTKGMNVKLYHLAFFSKHSLGNKFWDIVSRGYAGEQKSLF